MYDIASWMRHGNTLFDAMFYNIANLSAEARCLAIDEGILEGEILVVWPRSRGSPARRYRTVDDLLDPKDGLPGIAHVAVAGVGSSALGAMSLAQDIAEVVDAPVAGVVAGRGVWDWVFEGLEGFWVLGPPDQTGAVQVQVGETVGRVDHYAAQQTAAIPRPHIPWIAESRVLGEIMKRRANGLKLVVGHSKGAVIIANALADPGGDWMKRTAPHLYDLTYGNYPKKQSLPWGRWDKEVDKWKKRMEPLVAAMQQQAAPVMKENESPWMGVWKEHMEKEQRESMDLWLKQAVQAMGGLVPRLEAVEQAGREQAGREQAEASGESVPGTEDDPAMRIVTFGRPSAMPKAQHLVWQYMGTHDALGWCNRAIGTDTLLVPFKGHSLNPFTPMHMPLARLLDRALKETDPPRGIRFVPVI